jgi:uncharacterized membrane protein YdjX (TVP38/TMEM64 family)
LPPSPDLPPTRAPAARARGPVRLALAVLGLAAVVAAVWALNRVVTLDAVLARYDALQAGVDRHWVGAIGLFALAYAGAVAVSLPGASLLTLVGGLLFGWLAGGLAAVVAATAGAVALFLLARTALGPLLAGRAGPRLQKLLDALRTDAAWYLLFCRLAPVFPFWMVNLAAALVPTPLRVFALTTAVGIIPGSFAIAAAGAALADVVAQRKLAFDACVAAGGQACSFDIGVRHVLTPGVVAALLALGLLALVPVVLRRTGIMRHWRSSASPPGDAA